MQETKPVIVTRSIKHTFAPDEVAKLNVDFGNAYDAVKSAEADFDAIKAVHKAKITEAESRMTTLRATINAGFEMRDKELMVVFRPKDKKKDFYLTDGKPPTTEQCPILTEDMTKDDFHQELIQAESAFDKRKELELWLAGNDQGRLIIGTLSNRWFSALRCNIGTNELVERLDSEQMSFKVRHDAIKRAAKRCLDWIKETIGKDEAKGFEEKINAVLEAEKEKAE